MEIPVVGPFDSSPAGAGLGMTGTKKEIPSPVYVRAWPVLNRQMSSEFFSGPFVPEVRFSGTCGRGRAFIPWGR